MGIQKINQKLYEALKPSERPNRKNHSFEDQFQANGSKPMQKDFKWYEDNIEQERSSMFLIGKIFSLEQKNSKFR